ncbi:MAG: UDP-N-acetylglucosamine 2-epimerase (non-hydrolyzing) [Candidatus Methanoperedenaceae archaeon]|nr:UDP-N-acetylglucosamine 2-epimerase (non-hydrolyzing) [Candidatus Methanoperedenaceae archaeon]
MKKVAVIFGTRPEAIKLCPLILAMKSHPDFDAHVCVTAQHREMLDQTLEVFGVVPDVDLSIMQTNQTLSSLTSRAITAIDGYLANYKPDMVIVQGDTTTTFCASLTAFYHNIPVGHVEAGLRTRNKLSPFPEEINRVLTSHIADYHFAPTKLSKENLLREGIFENKIFITGNTVIDALFFAIEEVKKHPPVIRGLPEYVLNNPNNNLILITGHRRENFGEGFKSICNAIVTLAKRFPGVEFVYPVHLNPNVQEAVFHIMSGFENIHLIKPLSYLPFVALMERSMLILTDSGGVQEEAPSLGKPVLVMRDTTERPEAVDAGTVRLVGTDRRMIIDNVSMLLTDENAYNAMANAVNPYGDGKACCRILAACSKLLNGYSRDT